MSAIVFDTETTGFDDPVKIVEAAYITLDENFKCAATYYEQFDPGRPISFGAMAAHHIVLEDLVGCDPSDDFMLPPDVEYLIGHNVDFDWKAIGSPCVNEEGATIKRIDTLALFRKHFPDVDSHTQSAMLYFFYGPKARSMAKQAHSALEDVRNLHRLLLELKAKLGFETYEELWQFSEVARIPDKITFGKHDGMKIVDLPRDYKNWLLRQEWLDPYLRKAIVSTL